MRNLILHGGIFHPFEANSRHLAEALAERGIESELCADIEDGLRRLAGGGYRMLSVLALRWRMLDHEKYEPYREEHAMSLSAGGRDAIATFVRSGGALLGLHTASICFDDWPQWSDILGVRWRWGQSFHPPRGKLRVTPADCSHPLTQGMKEFEIEDELFSDLEVPCGEQALAWGWDETAKSRQPVLWAHHHGSGRVVYDALGHDEASLLHPAHRSLLQRAALWLTADDRETTTR